MSAATTAAYVIGGTMLATQTYYNEKAKQEQAKQTKMQERAYANEKAAAEKQQALSEQEMNKANQKKPNIAALMQANDAASTLGANSTMLTGPQGAKKPTTLGSNTLLGS